jgi:hypothetical protein
MNWIDRIVFGFLASIVLAIFIIVWTYVAMIVLHAIRIIQRKE